MIIIGMRFIAERARNSLDGCQIQHAIRFEFPFAVLNRQVHAAVRTHRSPNHKVFHLRTIFKAAEMVAIENELTGLRIGGHHAGPLDLLVSTGWNRQALAQLGH